MRNGVRKPLFERLSTSLNEGIRFARGDLKLRTTTLPELPPALTPGEVVRLRQRLGMSQSVFARTLNVSSKTLQSWEHGTRRPSQAALRLLQVLNSRTDAVLSVVGLAIDRTERPRQSKI
jgi:putative transcriptional regulator